MVGCSGADVRGAACSSAATITDESVVGDFSNSGAANTITKVNFTAGSNQILGATGRNSAGAVDRDYLTFTVPTGLGLTAITPLPGTQSAGPLGLSFIGLEAGNQLTLAPTAATAAGLLGWAHYSTSDIGVNILNTMATPNTGSSGFSVPLGPEITPFGFRNSALAVSIMGLISPWARCRSPERGSC